jgi:hypothetical protein
MVFIWRSLGILGWGQISGLCLAYQHRQRPAHEAGGCWRGFAHRSTAGVERIMTPVRAACMCQVTERHRWYLMAWARMSETEGGKGKLVQLSILQANFDCNEIKSQGERICSSGSRIVENWRHFCSLVGILSRYPTRRRVRGQGGGADWGNCGSVVLLPCCSAAVGEGVVGFWSYTLPVI